jgi:hypothetical protein
VATALGICELALDPAWLAIVNISNDIDHKVGHGVVMELQSPIKPQLRLYA